MTTKITIKHEGPNHKNVMVTLLEDDPMDADLPRVETRILSEGESCEYYVYAGRRIEVTETDA